MSLSRAFVQVLFQLLKFILLALRFSLDLSDISHAVATLGNKSYGPVGCVLYEASDAISVRLLLRKVTVIVSLISVVADGRELCIPKEDSLNLPMDCE